MCFFISNTYTSITQSHVRCILCVLRFTGCCSAHYDRTPSSVLRLSRSAVESSRRKREVCVNMSACGEFAEHVWKPGSCKNCFHPRSAHRLTGTAGSACVGEDEDGVTSPSPYGKPTIAVRPTMMNMDVTTEVKTDINVNTEQVSQFNGWMNS